MTLPSEPPTAPASPGAMRSIPGLRSAVSAALPRIFGKWEGEALPYLYTDSKGLVTTGTGNLVDPMSAALALPWKVNGVLATTGQVADDWRRVKNAFPGVQSKACASLTTVRLDVEDLAGLLLRTAAGMWRTLCAEFPTAANWPADAQLALLSISWAWGPCFPGVWDRIGQVAPGFGYGAKFRELLSDPPEFELAAGIMLDASAHEEKINPGIRPRDAGEVLMFQNAANVAGSGADYERLWYPATVATLS